MMDQSWAMKGELVLSCNCTVFCPCVLSLGNHPPTEGYCQTWAGFRIDAGHFGEVDLSGLNLGLIMEIPGYMSRGNWTAGLFIDKRASVYAVKALTKIFTGKAGGTTSLLSILVGKFLGVEQVPITYEACISPATMRLGSRRKSSWRSPTRARCAPSVATGISPAVRPRSASWIGEAREQEHSSQESGQENRGANSATEEESDVAAGARIFGAPAHRVRLVSRLPVACGGQ